MASISRTLQRIKDDLRPFLPDQSIIDACRAAGHTWRQRLLDPIITIHLFILQILNFNTAMTHLRHLAKYPVKAAAYCKARMRLPLAALQELLRRSSAAMRLHSGAVGLWHGLRAFLVDGSSTITPDTPDLRKEFGQPEGQKPGCGFPICTLLGLFDAFTGLLAEVLGFPLYTHEQSKVWKLHPLLRAGDLLVADRGFCSYVHLAMLQLRGVFGLFRMHQRQIVDFRPHRKMRKKGQRGRPSSKFIKRLGKHDHIVEWFRPKSNPKWMEQEQYDALPPSLRVRELRFWLPRKGQRTLCVTIATTLLDPVLYPKAEIAALFNVRWQVETHFGELKTTLKMRQVKSQTAEGVRKELAIYWLVYNLVHAVMVQAAARQQTTPERISFIDAVRWLLSAEPGEELAELLVNPLRPDRHEPRVVKHRQGSYPVMTRPRGELRKELKRQALEA